MPELSSTFFQVIEQKQDEKRSSPKRNSRDDSKAAYVKPLNNTIFYLSTSQQIKSKTSYKLFYMELLKIIICAIQSKNMKSFAREDLPVAEITELGTQCGALNFISNGLAWLVKQGMLNQSNKKVNGYFRYSIQSGNETVNEIKTKLEEDNKNKTGPGMTLKTLSI